MKQLSVISAFGLILLISLLFFGKIESPPKKHSQNLSAAPAFNISTYIQQAKQKLSPSQLVYISNLENSISRGDVKQQQVKAYNEIAEFWKDSAKAFIPYAHYLAEAAKLDNSEKNLTFAAQFILDNMRGESNAALKIWEAETAIDLFEKGLQLDPDNDSLKVGLGSCYIYGKGMIGNAEETMKGIQHLLQVVKKDSSNMKAQLVLGIGGVISMQFGKAVERLNKVVTSQPGNLEAVSWLADAYAGAGDSTNAVKWYQYSKRLVNNADYSKEVDERIKALHPAH